MGSRRSLSQRGSTPVGDLLAGKVFWGFVVLVRGLLAPALARESGDGDGHISSVVLALPLQTLIRGARRWRGCGLKGGNKLQWLFLN